MSANTSFAIGVTSIVLGDLTGINQMWPRTSKVASLLIAYPPTRAFGMRITQIIAVETAAASWRIATGILGATWEFAGGTIMNVGKVAGTYVAAVAAGYVIGALGGTVISGAIWGDKGAAKADSLYSFQETPKEYMHTYDFMQGSTPGIQPGDIGRMAWHQLTVGTSESWK